jgi:hypothetical protein
MASGSSPKALIEQRLILEAKRLLAHTSLTVEAIATKVGFSEPTNFVKFFRRHGGMRPLEFRARFPGAYSGRPLFSSFNGKHTGPFWVQKETHAPQQTISLFDHFVGASEQSGRDF